jgi:hypothetical protein
MFYDCSVRPLISSAEKNQSALELGTDPYGLNPGPCRKQRYQTIIIASFSALATLLFLFYGSFRGNAAVLAPSLFKPTSYEVVPGFFAQSLNSTNDTIFDFVFLPCIELIE